MAKKILLVYGILSLVFFAYSRQNMIEKLTLNVALEICKNNNLTYQQQFKQIEKAKSEYEIQRANYYPSFFVNSSFNYVSDLAKLKLPFLIPGLSQETMEVGVKDQYDFNATVKQPIFTGFRTKNLIKSAFEDIEKERFMQKIVTNNIQLQVYLVFYSANWNLLQQRVLDNSLTRIKQHLLTTKNLLTGGQVLPYDTIKVSNQLLEIITQRVKLKNAFKIVLSQLALILNVAEVLDIETIDLDDIVISLPGKKDLFKKAIQLRPELSHLRHQNQSLTYQKNAVRSGFFPQIFAQASYHYARPGVNFFEDDWMDYYTFGIGLQWELWHKSQTKNNIQKIDYLLDISKLSESELEAQIHQEIIQGYENLASSKEQIALTERLVAQEKEKYRIVREKFEQGQLTTTDLLDAETAFTAAELSLYQTKVEWLINRIKLDHAIGEI